MIEIELGEAFSLYLGALLLFLFSIWAFFTYREKKKKRPPDLFELAMCEYCQIPFLAQTLSDIHRCPRCGLLNRDSWYKKE